MLDFNSISNTIPETPGVYIYRDKAKKVIYVGKAVNLKNRVKSYFARLDILEPKTRAMITKAESIETITVQNELEALLLEADLIKRYKPPYNISMKDDKFYKYIVVEKPKLETVEGAKPVYKISTTRKKTKLKQNEYFGPYPESNSILLITKTLRRIFPYRDCPTPKFNRYKSAGRACLYGHIGLCPAPCQTGEGIEQNNENITKIKEYLLGKRVELFKKLESEMKRLSKEQKYEDAAVIRDQLTKYEYLKTKIVDIKEYINNPDLVSDKAISGVESLIKTLEENTSIQFENKDPESFRIETYDISNIQGTNAVGSMSVTVGGVYDKKEYRKFRIKFKKTPDDFFMLQETLSRRFSEANIEKWGLPDLIVIDGGKGQLSSAIEIMDKVEINLPIISIAKKQEELFYYDKNANEYKLIALPKSDEGLKIIIKGRDEAHRFGITYHRKLRLKQMTPN